MNTIKNNITNKIEINKSIFITKLIKIDSIKDIEKELEIAKKEYKDATHYVYAYIIDNYKKCSDDNEPSNTAGLPVLEIMNKYDLNNVLCIVIRYFGGIKLGANGLIRAYSKSIKEALNLNQIVKLIDGYLISFSINYKDQNQIDYILKDYYKEKEFLDLVKYTIKCDINILNKLDSLNIDYKIIKKIKLEN